MMKKAGAALFAAMLSGCAVNYTAQDFLVRDAQIQAIDIRALDQDGWIERAILYIVDQYKDDIADLISGTVARWDTDETSKKIETLVGRDLQFIRINGTVIGALAGLVIYTIAQLLTG